jgi:hypothetical protein
MAAKKLTIIQRIIKAVWPAKRAPAKATPQTCSECGQTFQGTKRQLTCSKPCKNNRRNRILSERWKPVDSPLVNAIHDADPNIKATINYL